MIENVLKTTTLRWSQRTFREIQEALFQVRGGLWLEIFDYAEKLSKNTLVPLSVNLKTPGREKTPQFPIRLKPAESTISSHFPHAPLLNQNWQGPARAGLCPCSGGGYNLWPTEGYSCSMSMLV